MTVVEISADRRFDVNLEQGFSTSYNGYALNRYLFQFILTPTRSVEILGSCR
jgi:hypothetical protein